MPTLDDAPTTTDTTPEPLTHVARCTQCEAGAKVRALPSGNGFEVLERYGVDVDTNFGVGANGHPTCPHGHGEMAYADEQLPADDAISQVAEQLANTKPRLPFPAPPINYEAFFRSIRDKRHEIARLEARFNDADDRRKKAKAALDTANEELGTLIDDLETREEKRLAEIARQQERAEAVADVGSEQQDETATADDTAAVADQAEAAPTQENAV